MAEYSTIISGFGGQGVILAGKVLARSGMEKGLNVTWLPSYGPEMRGGTANCTVIISDYLIGSPVVDNPSSLIAFNEPSFDKFSSKVKAGGNILINGSLMDSKDTSSDIEITKIDLNEIAKEIGSQKVINMIALGGWIRFNEHLNLDDVKKGMQLTLKDLGKEAFIDINTNAITEGYERSKEIAV